MSKTTQQLSGVNKNETIYITCYLTNKSVLKDHLKRKIKKEQQQGSEAII